MVFIFLIGCNAQEGVSSKFHFEKLGNAGKESDAANALSRYLFTGYQMYQSFEHDQLTRTEPWIHWRRFKRFCLQHRVATVGCMSLAAIAGCMLFVAIVRTRNR